MFLIIIFIMAVWIIIVIITNVCKVDESSLCIYAQYKFV